MVELDGWIESPPTAIEVCVTVGDPKPGQQRKLRADILKLALLRKARTPPPRCLLVVTSGDAARWLQQGWTDLAVRLMGVEVQVEELTVPEEKKLASARKRQAAGQRTSSPSP
jgi:hypothetical protein